MAIPTGFINVPTPDSPVPGYAAAAEAFNNVLENFRENLKQGRENKADRLAVDYFSGKLTPEELAQTSGADMERFAGILKDRENADKAAAQSELYGLQAGYLPEEQRYKSMFNQNRVAKEAVELPYAAVNAENDALAKAANAAEAEQNLSFNPVLKQGTVDKNLLEMQQAKKTQDLANLNGIIGRLQDPARVEEFVSTIENSGDPYAKSILYSTDYFQERAKNAAKPSKLEEVIGFGSGAQPQGNIANSPEDKRIQQADIIGVTRLIGEDGKLVPTGPGMDVGKARPKNEYESMQVMLTDPLIADTLNLGQHTSGIFRNIEQSVLSKGYDSLPNEEEKRGMIRRVIDGTLGLVPGISPDDKYLTANIIDKHYQLSQLTLRPQIANNIINKALKKIIQVKGKVDKKELDRVLDKELIKANKQLNSRQ